MWDHGNELPSLCPPHPSLATTKHDYSDLSVEARLCLYQRILCALLKVRPSQGFICVLSTIPSVLPSSSLLPPPSSSSLLLPSSFSLLPPPLLLPPPSLLLRAPQEPSTPTTPSDTRGLDVVDDSGALEGTPHDELVSMLRKQQQTALRYKRRFSEVKSQSICLLTYPPVSVCLSVCLSKSICFPICLFIHVRCPSI